MIVSNRIDLIDKNLYIDPSVDVSALKFRDVKDDPFRVYGLYNYKNEPVFKRLPDSVGTSLGTGIEKLYKHTAGGRVRFSTDSKTIAIKSYMSIFTKMPHMPFSGSGGFDVFVEDPQTRTYKHVKTFIPPCDMDGGFVSKFEFSDRKLRYITINFPLYNVVDKLEIGLDADAKLGEGLDYKNDLPIVYYGSSITQGGCASRPGNSYQSIISRELELDFINLGFSGNAKGEDGIVDYIRGLDMLAFVCDYDHNALTVEHLLKTHKRMYERFREVQPNTPYIMASRIDKVDVPECADRRDVIFDTYRYARSLGDNNVYIIDGAGVFRGYEDMTTVDTCHPNDLGFYLMAKTFGDEIRKALFDKNV